MVIFDKFKEQCTDAVMQLLKDNNVHVVIVPVACTDRVQPLDLNLNKSAEEFYDRNFLNGTLKESFNSSSKVHLSQLT